MKKMKCCQYGPWPYLQILDLQEVSVPDKHSSLFLNVVSYNEKCLIALILGCLLFTIEDRLRLLFTVNKGEIIFTYFSIR